MKHSVLGFSQAEILSLQKTRDGRVVKMDVVDLLILQNLSTYANRESIVKYNIDGKIYFSVQYSAIIDDLPIIDIKKQALSDRLDKLCFLGVLEKQILRTPSGTYTAFRMGGNYEKILFSGTSSELHLQKNLFPQMYSTTNQNTLIDSISNSINNKEKSKDKSLPKKKDFDEFVERMYALYPTKCPKRNKSLGKSLKDKKRIANLLKIYTEDEIERVFQHEIDEKYEKQYMQNFSTFLNNFPDPATICDMVEVKTIESEKSVDKIIINGQVYR